MKKEGFHVAEIPVRDGLAIRQQYQIPPQLYSCHTAIVDGYVLEGHIPAAEVTRLLAKRPDIIGLAVPGMPLGSPGMESPDGRTEPYDVLTFDRHGNIEIFASYGR